MNMKLKTAFAATTVLAASFAAVLITPCAAARKKTMSKPDFARGKTS